MKSSGKAGMTRALEKVIARSVKKESSLVAIPYINYSPETYREIAPKGLMSQLRI